MNTSTKWKLNIKMKKKKKKKKEEEEEEATLSPTVVLKGPINTCPLCLYHKLMA
jgi:hypothetical protein